MRAFVAPTTGYYKLEVWGGQGGSQTGYAECNDNTSHYPGGYGGYSVGVVNATKNQQLYVYVGGQGGDVIARAGGTAGYNGGGKGGNPANTCFVGAGGGGGATHISTKQGKLESLSNNRGTILIVAGGGGGAAFCGSWSANGQAGGISGVNINNNNETSITVAGGTQSTGYKFGLGENGGKGGRVTGGSGVCNVEGSGGGGGGFFGGHAFTGTYISEHNQMYGAGGSGYIGNSLLLSSSSITKHMTCYSCTTSTAAATRTNSNTNVSATATADYSKTGNGYARITYLGTTI